MKAALSILLLPGLVLLSGCHIRSGAYVEAMNSYAGDGKIEETTAHSLYSAFPGFLITLPAIKPSGEAETVFHLGRLPPTKHDEIGFLFLAEPATDLRALASRFNVALEVRDETGATVYRHSGITQRYVEQVRYSSKWSRSYWTLGMPYCPFVAGRDYTLHVRYTTTAPNLGPTLTPIVWSGGFW